MSQKGYTLLFYWFGVVAFLPVALIMSAWAIFKFALQSHGSYEEVFGTGDLIPIGSLLLFSLWVDTHFEDEAAKKGLLIPLSEVMFIVFGVLGMVAFGAMKAKGVELLREVKPPEGPNLLKSFATASWWFILYAVAHTTIVKALVLLGRKQ